MSQPQPLHHITEAEYLAFENEGEIRHEYVDGQIYAMAGAGDRHNRVTGNVFFHLRRQTRSTSCVTYQSDMKLRLENGRYFYYPDAMLCCNPDDNTGGYYREQPCIVVEVSSPSTSNTDRREKLINYQRITSLQISGLEVKTLWDGISFYYARKAYPEIQKLENEARKLIIYHEQIHLRHMKPSIALSFIEDQECSSFIHTNPLSESYFTDLGDYLFIHNISKKHKDLIDLIHEQSDKDERKCSSEKRKNRSTIIAHIRTLNSEIKTGLEILFSHKGDKVKNNLDQKLKNWGILVKFRNSIAHNHSGLRKDNFLEIKRLTEEFIEFFRDLSDFQCENHQRQPTQSSPNDVTVESRQPENTEQNINDDTETAIAEEESEAWELVTTIKTGVDIYEAALAFSKESGKPDSKKGVLVDTNETYSEGSLWDMFENDYVAIYGDGANQLNSLHEKDIVFFYLKGRGIIAAAEIKPGKVIKPDDWCHYKAVKFLTKKPNVEQKTIEKVIPVWQIRQFTGKNFFWARTLKVPYLDSDEAKNLLENIIPILGKSDDSNS